MHSVFLRYLFLLSFVFPVSCHSQPAAEALEDYYTVTRVVDGDTFYIDDGTAKGEKIRLIGIDAPESHRSQHKEVQYYGKEAAAYLTRLLNNKKVKLEYDVSRKDKYRRTLAYVYLENGLFVNAHLVESGYAIILTVPPNVKYADRFLKLQQEARKHKRGLWSGGKQDL